MTVRNFKVELADSTWQSAQQRAIQAGQPLEKIVGELLTKYARGEAEMTTYTVQRGDTLSAIARRFYGDPHKYPVIRNANKINDAGHIRVGQVLLIPALAAASSPPPVTPPVPPVAPPTPPVAPPVSPPATPVVPTLADYMQAMPGGFRPAKAGNLRAAYQFELVDRSEVWTVQVNNGACTVSRGKTAEPNVTIGINSDDLKSLARGQLNALQAYREGRLGVRGDVNLAARFTNIFGPWEQAIGAPTPTPPVTPTPPQPKPPAPSPSPGTTVNPGLLNGSFDDYQPYIRDGEATSWREFPEKYGDHWQMKLIAETDRRIHLMDSNTFGLFTQKYFGGGGHDYHIHGRHSQVITSRYGFDLVFWQTIAAQPGHTYTFSGSIVSFYKGPGSERGEDKIIKTIGIDPLGRGQWDNPGVTWEPRDGRDNEWRYPVVQVKAQANAITVFIRLENVEKDVGTTSLNTIHLDNFKVEIGG